jgi:transcriptional regulator with XRE-family HTH domain
MGKSGKLLSELVKEKRLEMGITQAMLAQRIGVTVQTVSNLETGNTRTFQMNTFEALAKALDVPIQDITNAAANSRRLPPDRGRSA